MRILSLFGRTAAVLWAMLLIQTIDGAVQSRSRLFIDQLRLFQLLILRGFKPHYTSVSYSNGFWSKFGLPVGCHPSYHGHQGEAVHSILLPGSPSSLKSVLTQIMWRIWELEASVQKLESQESRLTPQPPNLDIHRKTKRRTTSGPPEDLAALLIMRDVLCPELVIQQSNLGRGTPAIVLTPVEDDKLTETKSWVPIQFGSCRGVDRLLLPGRYFVAHQCEPHPKCRCCTSFDKEMHFVNYVYDRTRTSLGIVATWTGEQQHLFGLNGLTGGRVCRVVCKCAEKFAKSRAKASRRREVFTQTTDLRHFAVDRRYLHDDDWMAEPLRVVDELSATSSQHVAQLRKR